MIFHDVSPFDKFIVHGVYPKSCSYILLLVDNDLSYVTPLKRGLELHIYVKLRVQNSDGELTSESV